MKPEYTIDLIELISHLWSRKIFILKIIGLFVVLGLIVALGSKEEFTASCRFIVKEESGSSIPSGSLSSLAGLAGINLPMDDSQFLTPVQFNDLIKSHQFSYDLLNAPIYFKSESDTISSYQYFIDHYKPSLMEYIKMGTVGLPWQILKLFKDDPAIETPDLTEDFIKLSKSDVELLETFKGRITLDIDDETRIIKLSVVLPDADAASHLTNFTYKKLQNYILEKRQKSAKENLVFAKKRYGETKESFSQAQLALVEFDQGHSNLISYRGQAERELLESEYEVAFELYKLSATQLEQAKLELVESRPIFITVNPVLYPTDNSHPKRLLILILFTLLGGFSAIVYVTFKKIYF